MGDYDSNNSDFQASDKLVEKGINAMDRGIDAALDKEIAKVITNRAIICGLFCAIPLFGIETIGYAICLWLMYGTIAKKAGVPFKKHLVKNILTGFIVNWIIVFVLNHILTWFTFAGGFIVAFLIGYIATKWSGASYVGVLKIMHGKKAKAKCDLASGVKAMLSSNQEPQKQEKQLQEIPQTEKQLYDSQEYTLQPHLKQTMIVSSPQIQNNNLLTCSECGQQVSRRATACPNCGCPVSEMNINQQ